MEHMDCTTLQDCSDRCNTISTCKGYSTMGCPSSGYNAGCILKSASCTNPPPSADWTFYEKEI
eukprot:6228009-Prymnesium_polylepis.4